MMLFGTKDFTPSGIWPSGRIVKAHLSRDGVARSFDIKTSTGMVQRPAVRKCLKLTMILHLRWPRRVNEYSLNHVKLMHKTHTSGNF